MKVLMLSDVSSPHTEKWALGLASRGVHVGLFSFSKATYEWYHVENITVFFEPPEGINPLSTFTKISYLKYVKLLKKIIKHFKPDILHAHYASSYGLIGALSRFQPFVLSVWGSDVYNFPNRSKLHRKILQYNMKKAQVLLSTSNVMRNEIMKYTEKEILVTPFGVDMDVFSNRPPDSPRDGITRVGTIKPIRRKYGIEFIIEAAYILKQKGVIDKYRFYLIGSGELDYYRSLLKEKGVEKWFVVTGKVPFSDVSTYHNMLDIFLNVSVEDSESFGVATVEAMACEKPVIVTDVGGLMEVVDDGKFGRVVKRRNADELAAAIETLALNPEDAKALGTRARAHVSHHYDWNNNLDHMVSIYHSVLDKTTA